LKSFSDSRFALLFNRIVSATNPRLEKDGWRAAEVEFRRERHNYWGRDYAFSMEIYTLRSVSKDKWELLVVRENWWTGDRRNTVRSGHWGKLVSGRRDSVLAWFKRQRDALDASSESH